MKFLDPRSPLGFSLGELPYDFNEWVIDRIAYLVLQLKPEDREAFWRPFLELGTRAHYWVERFLSHWFEVGLGPIKSQQDLPTSGEK